MSVYLSVCVRPMTVMVAWMEVWVGRLSILHQISFVSQRLFHILSYFELTPVYVVIDLFT